MKGTHLGEFQEIVMLCILLLDEAYGVSIQEEIEKRTARNISRGALQTALTRLEEKGFIQSTYGEPTAERGGRRKRYYEVTAKGMTTLRQAKELRQDMWKLIPALTVNP